jgi:hypothetical protein
MKSHLALKLISLTLGLFALPSFAAELKRPNILLIVADDLGYGELSIQGNPQIPTPSIDSLAKSGVRFSSDYVSGPYCSPMRAGLLTGRYQQRFGHEFTRAVDGKHVAKGRAPGLIAAQPARGFTVGSDPGPVGDYTGPNALRGKIEALTLRSL